MKILILYNKPILVNAGGVQRVSEVLADQFRKDGHSVYYLSSSRPNNIAYNKCQYFFPDLNNTFDRVNCNYIRDLIVNLEVNLH